MTVVTKFPRTKLAIVSASVLGTVAIWVALAWPQWNAGAMGQDASATADTPAAGLAAEASAAPIAPPPEIQAPVIIRRVYVITRSSAPASSPARRPAVAAPPPRSTQDQPSPSDPQRSQPHSQPITRSRGS